MIRFNCPTCDRAFVLADAYAGLPLLCKGCGQRVTPPPPQPDPEPEPVRPAAVVPPPVMPIADDAGGPIAEEIDEAPSPSTSPPAGEVAEVRRTVAGGRSAADAPPTRRGAKPAGGLPRKGGGEEPSPPPAAAKPAGSRRLVAGLVDGVLALVLLAVGALAGEEVVGRPTPAILEEAGSSPTFPPTDLVLWGGCVLVPLLVYVWLGARGWTVGGWLKRRAA